MRPSMPYPNAERAYQLWQDSQAASARWNPVALEGRGRRRRVIPATIWLAIGLRLVPLLVLVGIVAFNAGRS